VSCIYYKRNVLTDDRSGGACEGAVVMGGCCATAASLTVLVGVKLAKNSSSQLKNMRLSSGERFDQSISVSREVEGGLGITTREWKSGRVDRTMGGGPFVIGGGFG